jgi:vanillate O-demethylase ferredoxin subunit
VAKRIEEARDICSFELVSDDGAALPPFSAGAHIDVQIPSGLVRQYSLCNSASERHRYQIGVLREPKSKGGSAWLHEKVREGDVIFISSPKNHFPLANNGGSTLLFAGGIGITPLLCMAESLSKAGRVFALHYCARSADRMAFRRQIREASFSDRVSFYLDDASAEEKLDLDDVLRVADPKAHLYVCGPGGFIEHVFAAAGRHRWELSKLHCEYFSGDPVTSGRSFTIRLARSGATYLIPPDKTVTDVLAANGVVIPVSCEQGVCGTCVTKVIAGEPDHRDRYLTPAERSKNDQFMPCCSRALNAELVIDL